MYQFVMVTKQPANHTIVEIGLFVYYVFCRWQQGAQLIHAFFKILFDNIEYI